MGAGEFVADLHLHSRHARATSRQSDLEHGFLWALRKGITVLGTGDFTHPAWRAELRRKLRPAEPGLFRLRPALEASLRGQLPATCQGQVRFMLTTEIATIRKEGDRVRRVHHVVLMPGFREVARLCRRLGAVGNLEADGRPMLGMRPRDLLEAVLESGEGACLIPAHIWTPWYSALGAKSGFDSIAACYGSLTEHIPAVETGLSSDPAMNWRVPCLDPFQLVSNSDAHSPAKLGRNATLFDCPLGYFAMQNALRMGKPGGLAGTIEFYPEEGKYHWDVHRKCGVSLHPTDAGKLGGACPECGKPLTQGVLHRVARLATRPEGAQRRGAPAVYRLIPLAEVLAELLGRGPDTKGVQAAYGRLLESLGPELWVLRHAPLEALAREAGAALAEGIRRMRAGQVHRRPGYDGVFGRIRLLDE